jgi:ABC-2 type transport system permease protein
MTRLLRFQARRDRRQLLVWVIAIGVLVVATGQAVSAEFPTEIDRVSLLRLALVTPALLAFRGVPNGSSEGSLVYFQLFSWLAVVVGLLNTFLAIRHGRADEERGRAELLLSGAVPRTAPVAATWLLGTAVDVVVAVVACAAFLALGLPAAGAVLAGAALGVTGFAFLGVGLLASQISPTSRAANGLAGAVVGAAYLLRAAGDALARVDLERMTAEAAWPSWLSPIGWGEQAFAFTANRPAPLLLSLGLGGLCGCTALVLQARRDLGRSLLLQRPGRATGSVGLRSGLGLAWRLQWPAVLSWAAGAAVLGFATGSLSRAVAGATLDNPQVRQVLSSLAAGAGGDLVGVFLTAILSLVGVLAAAAGLQAVLRMRSEETDGTVELVLAGRFSRLRWLVDALLMGALAVLAVLVGVAAASALSFAATGDGVHAALAARQAFAGLPAALVFVGLGAVLVAALPRLAVAGSWALFGVAVVVGLFGVLLRLPEPARDVSPFSHLPTLPIQDWSPLAVMTGLSLALACAAALALRRRDIPT